MVSSISVNGDAEGLKNAPLRLEDEQHTSRILASLYTMKKNRTLCDVILHVGKGQIQGHRAILAAASPYILEQLTEKPTHELVVTIQLNDDLDIGAVKKLVDYVYTSRLEIQETELEKVYVAARALKMEGVAAQCATNLLERLTPKKALDIRGISRITDNDAFVKQVENYIRQNLAEIFESQSFTSALRVKLEVLYQTSLEMDLVNETSLGYLVLDYLKRFLEECNCNFDLLTEKKHLLYLALDNSLQDCSEIPSGDSTETDLVIDYKKLSHKTFTLNKNKSTKKLNPASPRVIILNRDTIESLEDNVELDWNMIGSIKSGEHTYLAVVTLNGRVAKLSIRLRLNAPTSPSHGAGGAGADELHSSSSEPELYCSISPMKSGKCSFGCAEFNGALLVCGGYDRVECLKTVEKYVPESNTWEPLPALNEPRGRFDMAVLDGKVFVVGGSNGSTELATVEMFEEGQNKWKTMASLDLARSYVGVCSMGNKIYCVGGWNGNTGIKQCHVFDPEANAWTEIAPLKTGRYQAGVIELDGKVWVIGGCDSWNCLTSVEIYDPATNEWTEGPSLRQARRGCGVAVYEGRLMVVGGSTGTHSLTTTEIYDPLDRQWTTGPSMTTPRSNVGVAVISDRLYAVGGYSGKSFLSHVEYLDFYTNEWTNLVPKYDGIRTPPEYCPSSGSSAHGSEKDMPQSTSHSEKLSKASSAIEKIV
ncbi:influenza virus NS1A-binding protein homolog [Trichogramma pretiosum]|uniref:influenza virus NS1A-binding protein homolog n=1 Tax=Trichogramma pretiosum TaxID=7493 RepID=UPI0006C98242|nr:influenza virus NS1A-binding protein homolog [Trichogramma pretiosum]XP_014227553.1 influenza virus NS1A-binding protein homolog [Trichogramma pretiosum]